MFNAAIIVIATIGAVSFIIAKEIETPMLRNLWKKFRRTEAAQRRTK